MDRLLHGRALASILAVSTLCFASTSAARAESEGGEKVYQRLLKSAVWVISPLGKGLVSSGSGSLIDIQHRLILTNYHVVEDREVARVFFPAYQRNHFGKTEIVAERDYYKRLLSTGGGVSGKVIARSMRSDLALIQIEAVPSGALPVRLSFEGAMPGQRVHSIGNPGGSGALWVYTSGTVRQVYHKRWKAKLRDRIIDLDTQVVETQSPTNHGDSGGPLVNDRAELVGVTQGGTMGDTQLMSTFIDVGEVRALLKKERIKLGHAPALAATTHPSSTRPEINPPGENGTQAERDARRQLKLAKTMADDGKRIGDNDLVDKAKARYQQILETFPQTKAAEEARQLLEKLNK
jgi:S1-C subfamily serine protease